MKVYYVTNGESYESDQINGLANEIVYLMLERLKYKLMWTLRKLEKEINESDGCIIITLESLESKLKIEAKGFSKELSEKIYQLASKAK